MRTQRFGARPLATVAVVLALCACSGGGKGNDAAQTPVSTGPTTSFLRMQTQIFERSCASSSCHAVGNSSGTVVLAGQDVYSRLVGVSPFNAVAKTDRLALVLPGKPDSSLLWHKLNAFINGHHVHDYGATMPQAQPLSVEQLEFVREWIANGAPSTGDAINPQLLSGSTPPSSVPYVALTPPTTGFQLAVPAFTVQPSFERELFVYKTVGNGADVYVNRIQTSMRSFSHHFALYTFQPNTPSIVIPPIGQIRDIRNSDGTYNILNVIPMEYHIFFAGTQTTASDFTFPPGVALKIPAGMAIDMNSHYVNSSGQDLIGQAEANLYTVPASSVTTVASALNLNNTDLTVPQGRDTTIVRTFRFSVATRIVMLTSHAHKRLQTFVIRIAGGARNGEVVYTSTSWDHPVILTLTTPIVLQAGEGLTSEATYRGDPSKVVRFGLTSDDEMDIIFGYWY